MKLSYWIIGCLRTVIEHALVRLVFCFLFLITFLTAAYNSENFQLTLTALQKEVRINDDVGTSAQVWPALAMNPNQYNAVYWMDGRNGPLTIVGQRGNEIGMPIGANFQVPRALANSNCGFPAAAMNRLGHTYLTWQETVDRSTNVFLSITSAGNRAMCPIVTVNEETVNATTVLPAIAVDKNGNCIVAWMDTREDSSGDIFIQRFNPTGGRIGNNLRVNDHTNHEQKAPQIAVLDDGGFVVVWEDGRDYHRSPNVYAIYAQLYDSAGTPVNSNFQVSQHAPSKDRAFNPKVAVALSGNLFICWQFGNPSKVFGHVFSKDGNSIKSDFIVHDTSVMATRVEPRVRRHPFGWFSLMWSSNAGGDFDIYHRIFDQNGAPLTEISPMVQAAGNQIRTDFHISNEAILLMAWEDYRNGNADIYGKWAGIERPIHVKSGSGFSGMIPVRWDPVFGKTNITKYFIERGDSYAGPFSEIATVDLSLRGPLGLQMLDYIDTDVVNGQTYYYRIRAQLESGKSTESAATEATPSENGYLISTLNTTNIHTTDGVIDPAEWNGARSYDIAGPGAPLPITLYLEYDADSLYIAVDDPNDPIVDPANMLGIMFDSDTNSKWDATAPSDEGILTVNAVGAYFTAVWGEYPDQLVAAVLVPADFGTWGITDESGHVQYELTLDMRNGLIKPESLWESEVNLAIWIDDPTNFYPHQYGHAGRWPWGALWEAAETMGSLRFMVRAAHATSRDWPMAGYDAQRSSNAWEEEDLKPPFTNLSKIALEEDYLAQNFVFFDSTIFVMTNPAIAGQNRIYAINFPSGDENWWFEFPNPSKTSRMGIPAVNDSMVFCGDGGGAGLYGLGRKTGTVIWNKPVGDLYLRSPILSGNRVFIVGDDSLYCLDTADGATIWARAFASTRHAQTVAVDYNYVYWIDNNRVYALDIINGQVVWEQLNYLQYNMCTDMQYLYTLAYEGIVARNKNDGSVQWTYSIPGGVISTFHINRFALSDDYICFSNTYSENDSAKLYVVNKSDGTLKWVHPLDMTTVLEPTIANDICYVMNLYLEKVGQATYAYYKLDAFDLNTGDHLFEDSSAKYAEFQPVVAGGCLMVPVKDSLYILSNQVPTAVRLETKTETLKKYGLLQNYPNPFNAQTTIEYYLAKQVRVELEIYNALGQHVRTLIDNHIEPIGTHQIVWDGKDQSGQDVGSGVYICRLSTASFSEARKILVIR